MTGTMPLFSRLALSSVTVSVALSLIPGCGSSESSRSPDKGGRDGGDEGSGGAESGGKASSGGTSAGGTSSGGVSSGGTTPSSGGTSAGGTAGSGGDAPVPDAGPDASADGGSPPVTDASTDAADANTADARGPLNALFAHIGGQLVRVNPETGALTEIGPTGQDYVVISWDHVANVARVIANPYSGVGAGTAPSPRLGVMNLCTGVITATTPLAVGATAVRRAEGLALHPDTGVFWITYGTAGTGSAQQYLTEANGTVNITTGAVTLVGTHQTLQDDGDLLFFLGSTLQLLDVAVGNNAGAVYTVNQATGAATVRAQVGPTVLRLAFDPTRNVVFGVVGSGSTSSNARGLVTVNPDTGASTLIGSVLAPAAYPGESFRSLLSVPEPVCP